MQNLKESKKKQLIRENNMLKIKIKNQTYMIVAESFSAALKQACDYFGKKTKCEGITWNPSHE